MNHTAHISHDAVLRARVALLGSQALTVRQEVAAYRVLAQVSPLAYLPLLARALCTYSRQEFAVQPGTALALRAEAVAAARRMYSLEAGRVQLLIVVLRAYRLQLAVMGRQEELGAVEREIALLDTGHQAELGPLEHEITLLDGPRGR
ncbi:hypothetical protein OHA91_03645 [Streptomyces erythrochromogenes]|uniref:Uncharacterized protein n=1 Tax=Streptomyces erythrochromogenes TaxID=285574 RepID=A0ABZ1Q4R4_9ACTN|nr:hypothetical protein [Streptomyces erythrochromogenes]MCX5583486.1 hypothetical protein [Streptomyces erythrochromogenes]